MNVVFSHIKLFLVLLCIHSSFCKTHAQNFDTTGFGYLERSSILKLKGANFDRVLVYFDSNYTYYFDAGDLMNMKFKNKDDRKYFYDKLDDISLTFLNDTLVIQKDQLEFDYSFILNKLFYNRRVVVSENKTGLTLRKLIAVDYWREFKWNLKRSDRRRYADITFFYSFDKVFLIELSPGRIYGCPKFR